MSKNVKFRNEEYAPGASFLMSSFSRDREELEVYFSEFTPAYEAEFGAQIKAVEKMESDVVMSLKQEEATKLLYGKADAMNKAMNVLSFYFMKAKVPTDVITKAKSHLMKRNVEGACKHIEGIVQVVQEEETKLVPFGMKVGYSVVLDGLNEELKVLNVKQNDLMNEGEGLTTVNAKEYKKLYEYIQNICRAGKILFDDTYKEDEYTMRQLIRRMRSGN
ncbi:MAG: hypothetical protein EOO43_07010 [Flavobacterium sp.]|nr:MAG: hypothetical protein EOO43_07010 [Flavobacterium sp.]